MNAGRFLGAVAAVWIVRTIMNAVFYGKIIGSQYAAIAAAHPGMFRQVVPGFVIADLISAAFLVLLFAKVAPSLGGGVSAGVKLGIFVAILAPVVGSMYEYYSVTYMSASLVAAPAVYQVVAHMIQGAIAGAIYKTAPTSQAKSAAA